MTSADELKLDADGNLLIQSDAGELMQRAPVTYQVDAAGRTTIPSKFVIAGDLLRFEIGDYDTSRTLYIDPVVSYWSYLGGNRLENAIEIEVDDEGFIYVIGETSSTSFPTTDNSQGAGNWAYVTKIDPRIDGANSIVYSTVIRGGNESANVEGTALHNGQVGIVGYTNSTMFPVTVNAFVDQNPNRGGGEFVGTYSQLGTDGKIVYSTYLGNGSLEQPKASRAHDLVFREDGVAQIVWETAANSIPFPNSPVMPPQLANDPAANRSDGVLTLIDPTKSGNASVLYQTFLGEAGRGGATVPHWSPQRQSLSGG